MKTSGDAVMQMAVINVVGGIFGFTLLLFFGLPERASWPFLLGSLIVHQIYFAVLILGYRYGDLSDVYPIARGIAPLLVAGAAFIYVGETLTLSQSLAVIIISAGILSLGLSRRWSAGAKLALTYALITGVTIATYTIIDGMGVRRAGNSFAYIGVLFAMDAFPITIFVVATKWGRVRISATPVLRAGVIGGMLAACAYGIVIWAMSTSYLTFVSALRETSVVMAALIGTYVLKEPFGKQRLTGACVVVGGVILLHLA